MTVCSGIAGVKAGIHMTRAECASMTDAKIAEFMNQVASLITVPVTANTLAAHTSFAYNIGIEGYKRSKALRLTNEGKIAQGCAAMMGWHTVGDKDCEIRQNGCYGIVERRNDEIGFA